VSDKVTTRNDVIDIQAMCLGINTVPKEASLEQVLTITVPAMIGGRFFRKRSQYVFTTSRESNDVSCNCSITEWLVEIEETVGPEGQVVPAWTGWISELFAVAPARERLAEPDQDPTGSYSRKWVNSVLPPWLRRQLNKGTGEE
jgi:hypothetical protein